MEHVKDKCRSVTLSGIYWDNGTEDDESCCSFVVGLCFGCQKLDNLRENLSIVVLVTIAMIDIQIRGCI